MDQMDDSTIRHCPACEQEYDAPSGAAPTCADCQGALLAGPLPEPQAPEPDPLDATGDLETVAVSTNAPHVRFLEGLLREEQMPTQVRLIGSEDLGAYGGFPEPMHVLLVPADRLDEAREICEQARSDSLEHADSDALAAPPPADTTLPSDSDDPGAPPYDRSVPALVGSVVIMLALSGLVLLLISGSDSAGDSSRTLDSMSTTSISMLGAIPAAALIGGGAGIWVLRRKGASRMVLYLLLLMMAVPVAIPIILLIVLGSMGQANF